MVSVSKKKLRMDQLVKMNVEQIKNDSGAIKRIEDKIEQKHNQRANAKVIRG